MISVGKINEQLTWEIGGGTLTIRGNGEMQNNNFATFKDFFHTVVIESGVRSIKYHAFGHHKKLTSITIPNTVKSIEDRAFLCCDNLKSITNFNNLPIKIDSSVFAGVSQSKCILRVPTSYVPVYKNADVWKEFIIVGIR